MSYMKDLAIEELNKVKTYTISAIHPDTLELEEAFVTFREYDAHHQYTTTFSDGTSITNSFSSSFANETR